MSDPRNDPERRTALQRGWLNKQLQRAEKDVKELPDWLREKEKKCKEEEDEAFNKAIIAGLIAGACA
jgi:hypothetical protein